MVVIVFLTTMALQSCDQSSEKLEQNKASIVNANDELFNKGSLDYADKVFAAEYSGHGPSHIKEFVSARRKAFQDLQVTIEPVIAEGDMVAWQRTNTGTQTGDYMGHKPTSKKVTWKEMIFTRYNSEGKIAEEWALSNMNDMLNASSGIEGLFEYLPPLKGQGVNRNGRFVYLFGPANGNGPMTSQGGTQQISGDTVKNTIEFSTDPKQVGTTYSWRIKSISGDTTTYEILDEKGQVATSAKAIKVSN